MFRKYFLPFLTWAFYYLLSQTWRVRLEEAPSLKEHLLNREPFIIAHWHGDELAILFLVRRYRLCTLTSHSKDGQLIDYVIRKLGGYSSKGSSSRGAIGGLKGLVRLLKAGHPASMAPDGPRGPIHQVKPGVFELSRLAKAPIYALGVTSSNSFVFEKSWNKAHLPKPFAQLSISVIEVMPAITREQDPKSKELSQDLGRALAAAKKESVKLIAQDNSR